MPVIQVVIFRGTGGVYNTAHPYYGEAALVRAGHVGVIGIIDNKIIGFHPTSEAAEAIGGEKALLNALANKTPQPGCLQDDNEYFERAHELSDATNGRTSVYTYEMDISEEELEEIRSWYNERKESLYNFPDDNGQFNEEESNCALFWNRFNIQMPIQTGNIKELTRYMRIKRYEKWLKN